VELRYRPSVSDAFDMVLWTMWGTRRQALRSLVCFAITGIPLILAFYRPEDWRTPQSVAVFALGVVGWALLFTFGFSGLLAGYVARRQLQVAPVQRIVLSDDGIQRTVARRSARIDWSAISHVKENSFAFLLYDDKRFVAAIEKSAAHGRTQLEALRQYLRSRKPGTYYGDDRSK